MGAYIPREPQNTPPGEPASDWHVVAHGWAIYQHWRRWDPCAADAHRSRYVDEQRWLLELGTSKDGHRLKLLVERLEEALELVREVIRQHHGQEQVNRQFIGSFRAELEHVRAHPPESRDALGASHQALKRLVPLLKRMTREIEDGACSLFG